MSKAKSRRPQTWQRLRQEVLACESCPRLIDHCRTVAQTKRKAYREQTYWGKPVPNFGQPKSDLLVVGLAPGAHGANRTGRMFTGDRSGDWLYRAMHRAGFANQPQSQHRRDGLQLLNAAITNIGRCAPPDNKPTTAELTNCLPFFEQTLALVDPIVIVALGGLAWRQTLRSLVAAGQFEKPKKMPAFGHRATLQLNDRQTLVGSYHPSQQNTFTGRLTEKMLDQVFTDTKKLISRPSK